MPPRPRTFACSTALSWLELLLKVLAGLHRGPLFLRPNGADDIDSDAKTGSRRRVAAAMAPKPGRQTRDCTAKRTLFMDPRLGRSG